MGFREDAGIRRPSVSVPTRLTRSGHQPCPGWFFFCVYIPCYLPLIFPCIPYFIVPSFIVTLFILSPACLMQLYFSLSLSLCHVTGHSNNLHSHNPRCLVCNFLPENEPLCVSVHVGAHGDEIYALYMKRERIASFHT